MATAPAGAEAMSAVADPCANTVPMSDAPLMRPRLRDRPSMPETTPRRSGPTSAMTAVLLAVWNTA
ncbi:MULTISPECIES: hypothetical protein [unclassified Streptomyces]|uniref:hypothetical protein n=1 Tax=unclassified Streptomyces TaxID=2593676 RepID=UPI002E2B8F6B|nr:hypothetical protein [Streptomyces sp. NBC_01439]